MKEVLLIFLGGGTGSAFRFLVQQFAGKIYAGVFPLGTLLVNVTGSFLIGFALGYLGTAAEGHLLRPFFVVGFCGGFTTFSSFSNDAFQLIRTGDIGLAAVYIIFSFIICILFTALGIYLAK